MVSKYQYIYIYICANFDKCQEVLKVLKNKQQKSIHCVITQRQNYQIVYKNYSSKKQNIYANICESLI